MSMEIITIIVTIISANIALAALFVGLFAWLRQDMKEQGKEIKALKREIETVKKEIEALKVEVAALKATVETWFRVQVDPPRTAAVAEPPEDYGAD